MIKCPTCCNGNIKEFTAHHIFYYDAASGLKSATTKETKRMNTAELCKMIGSHLGEDSFLYWAYKNDIPVAVPGIMDGAVQEVRCGCFLKNIQTLYLM